MQNTRLFPARGPFHTDMPCKRHPSPDFTLSRLGRRSDQGSRLHPRPMPIDDTACLSPSAAAPIRAGHLLLCRLGLGPRILEECRFWLQLALVDAHAPDHLKGTGADTHRLPHDDALRHTLDVVELHVGCRVEEMVRCPLETGW
jgi:hypothetical protein